MLSDAHRRNLILINVFGGIAVLASYAWGALGAPDTMGSLWGGVPEGLLPVYTTNMFLAAAGYFAFSFVGVAFRTSSSTSKQDAPRTLTCAVTTDDPCKPAIRSGGKLVWSLPA